LWIGIADIPDSGRAGEDDGAAGIGYRT